MRARLALLLLLAPALAGCNTSQSTLHPGGPNAGAIATLSWALFIGGGAILLFVCAAAAFAIYAPAGWRRWMTGGRFVMALGVAFPIVTLSALLVYGAFVNRDLLRPGAPALRIEVVGEMWWWRVRYLDAEGRTRLVSANEIRMPTGRPVEFVLTTENVIHSFWVPSLAGKLDMIPGRVNVYSFSADKPGVYRGQCAEYCGDQHALMAFNVVAMEPADFEAWYARETAPAAEPATPFLARGRDVFFANGCQACHTVRGTPAVGALGPDLTHFGSRRSVAAGALPLNVGTIAGWIASAQHIKPGNLMPSFENLRGEELRAVSHYLESLK